MIKSMAIAAMIATVPFGVQAQEFNLQPENSGTEIILPASVSLQFKNDMATLILSATAEEKSLAEAQSKVNARMASAQKAIQNFSSLARIENGGYYTQVIYTDPKEGEAPTIAGWKAQQSIRVYTEDVDGVASLVQVAQQSDLGVDSVSYGLSEDAKAASQDRLSKAVINALNQKAESIALAMKIPPESLKIKKMEFNNTNFPDMVMAPRSFAVNTLAKSAPAMPTFEAGTSRLTMSVSATLSVEGVAVP